jgi:hypothetical protein
MSSKHRHLIVVQVAVATAEQRRNVNKTQQATQPEMLLAGHNNIKQT